MKSSAKAPVAFANDKVNEEYYLRNLPEEKRRVREAMAVAERSRARFPE